MLRLLQGPFIFQQILAATVDKRWWCWNKWTSFLRLCDFLGCETTIHPQHCDMNPTWISKNPTSWGFKNDTKNDAGTANPVTVGLVCQCWSYRRISFKVRLFHNQLKRPHMRSVQLTSLKYVFKNLWKFCSCSFWWEIKNTFRQSCYQKLHFYDLFSVLKIFCFKN